MPTYQYVCTECGERLEAVQSFTDAALTECMACQGRLRKVFSPVGVVFKGSGFYQTDSRSSANGKAAADKGQSNGSAEKGETKSSTGDTGAKGESTGAKGESTGTKGESTGTSAKAESSAGATGRSAPAAKTA